ncbi:LacI family DNA-binding transcriptional regulator [Guptibacillus hwajinpoensis]|uniref:DNA-binding LacI/PurR family transcriptional regulator n=1 Tax=Guptibacillus hwajinpoensis TaxID=208199 RepID=A0ABU0K282_9BACL|nr:LacI family DNA-binding transcriptional regulator [Alkalihalobacillus hemicentroti]MDQ0483472.1 DNA-binding LacI/PurR family transcriptional regulator [Alkalihalobacillus hemicentroti]
MAVTIKDVAKLANVAPSTVSRVIANNPRISEQTKRRVREAMEYLGYHPNYNARSLANKSTQTIGLVMPSSADKVFQNPFFPEVLRGISTKAHEKEYTLYMSTGSKEEDILEGVMGMVHGRRVDGIVMLYSRIDDKIMTFLQEQNFPFTVIGKPFALPDTITHVDNDNYRAAKDVTEHFIEKGHECIAFVGGNLDLVVTVDRLSGYEKALREAGIPHNDDYVVHVEFLKEGGQEAVMELFSLPEPPTALVVVDDLMALGIMSKLDEIGLSVPEDVSIISFNNVMLAEYASPPLTSVDINIFELGYEAVNCLLEKIADPDAENKRVCIPHKVVERWTVRTQTENGIENVK